MAPQSGGMTLLARQRSQGVPLLPKPAAERDPWIAGRNHRAVASSPIPLCERDGGGGRNARATSARSRALPECPPAIHPRESPVCRWLPLVIRQAQEIT